MSVIKDQIIELNGTKYNIALDSINNSGGNGEVVFATTELDEREYAIKFLLQKNSDEKKCRFEKEIEFCKEDRHPNIIKIIECGQYKKHLYYIMKKLPHTLRFIIENEDNPIVLLDYVEELCLAIKYIHGEKVIHRDIKPENILIDEFGKLVLADFGMAHFVDLIITKPQSLMANRNYAAPEQRVIGNANILTSACDVYAFGAIINEMFTKQNPNGTKFVTISDKYPYLAKLDDVVYRCLRQDPIERPDISAVYNEIKLLIGELKTSQEDIQDFLLPADAVEFNESEIKTITRTASFDILSANYIFNNKSLDELEIYNVDFHNNIRYNVNPYLKNIYFQYSLLRECKKKFCYESNVYSREQTYQPLYLRKKHDKEIYAQFKKILENYICDDKQLDVSAQILKYFSSCCNYHCRELISSAVNIEKKIDNLDASPILYIVYKMRQVLGEDIRIEFSLEDYLSINWDKTYIGNDDNILTVEIPDDEEIKVLQEFQNKWGISFSKMGIKHYSITFSSKEKYLEFKKFSLEFSRSDYYFEGDVLDILKIHREFAGLVELYPVNDYDINFVLTKLLGIEFKR